MSGIRVTVTQEDWDKAVEVCEGVHLDPNKYNCNCALAQAIRRTRPEWGDKFRVQTSWLYYDSVYGKPLDKSYKLSARAMDLIMAFDTRNDDNRLGLYPRVQLPMTIQLREYVKNG